MGLRGKQFWAAFKETEVKQDELNIPEIVPEFKGDKTPSARLRSILFVYWTQKQPVPVFDDFYKGKMNEICEYIKEKLSWTTKKDYSNMTRFRERKCKMCGNWTTMHECYQCFISANFVYKTNPMYGYRQRTKPLPPLQANGSDRNAQESV